MFRSFKKNQNPSELEKGFPPNSPYTHSAMAKILRKCWEVRQERGWSSSGGGNYHQAGSLQPLSH